MGDTHLAMIVGEFDNNLLQNFDIANDMFTTPTSVINLFSTLISLFSDRQRNIISLYRFIKTLFSL
jgi:hypothetical protein